MKKTIALVTNNKECAQKLQQEAEKLNVVIKYEVQSARGIENKLNSDDIIDSDAVLFSVYGSVEEIEDIERFIDLEYYEVDSDIIIKTPEIVIKEIIEDLK